MRETAEADRLEAAEARIEAEWLPDSTAVELLLAVRPSRLAKAIRAALGTGEPERLPSVAPQPVASAALRILVAEDDRVNQLVVATLLQSLGYTATIVADGQQALATLAERVFDLVLLDIQMPGMDGFAVARSIVAR